MIIEFMLMLIAVGAGIVFVAWTNSRRRKQDAQERREVADSTGKLKQELERTANEIIGRMENHVTHLENILDESERNRTQLEGRVIELKKLLKKSEGQSGEIRDLLARLDDAGAEVDTMQRKMDNVERKLNLAMTTPLPVQQPIQQMMTPPLVTPMMNPPPVTPMTPRPPVTQVTTPPAQPLNPLGPITIPPLVRPAPTPQPSAQKNETPPQKNFDKILEESISEKPAQDSKLPRSSIVLSPETKQPRTVVEADPVKIEATRKKLTEASAKMATAPPEEPVSEIQTQPLRKKRKTNRSARDVRKAALDAIREAEEFSASKSKPAEEPQKKSPPEIKILPERRDLKLETTDSSIIKEMLLSGMSIEDISRETGLGRGAIELVQEMTRRQLERR
ncbi:MAG: hypothetical protein IJS69_00165 [Selenomonadaceae bacterium]|nr:hypothetical protein [Selenomonadaceae bacterium]